MTQGQKNGNYNRLGRSIRFGWTLVKAVASVAGTTGFVGKDRSAVQTFLRSTSVLITILTIGALPSE
jgi:hypothetical protein